MAKYLGRPAAASLAISGIFASEFQGTIHSGGLPLPGATHHISEAMRFKSNVPATLQDFARLGGTKRR